MKAFPRTSYQSNDGMDLRDYFASKAMPLAFQFWTKDYYELELDDEDIKSGFLKDMPLIAETSYEMADAMMEARNAK